MSKEEKTFMCNNSYVEHCLNIAKNNLSSYNSVDEIKENQNTINAYENIEHIEEPKNIALLDADDLSESDIERAEKMILDGKFFSEHAAAGEATRLGLGTKYLINISEGLSLERISKIMSEEKGTFISTENIVEDAGCEPKDILNLSMGTRHMLQFSFDITKLAKKHCMEPSEVLRKQRMLIVLNKDTVDQVIGEFITHNFFGFSRENVFFMVQQNFHGLNLKGEEFSYDRNTPRRLHNHGQMVMQQTLDDQIFSIADSGVKKYLKAEEFGKVLKEMENKISYNIDDLEYLRGSIDFESLAFALKKSEEGYRMLMEVVANNPDNPQKGGMAAFDSKLGRNVMIESFQLKGIKNEEIKFLNKNFNHYPKPYEYWNLLRSKRINMPVDVKNGFLYFQPVQGDINFLVNTEFFRRKELKTIKSWKSPATTPLAMKFMKMQDSQEGFKDYAESVLGKKID